MAEALGVDPKFHLKPIRAHTLKDIGRVELCRLQRPETDGPRARDGSVSDARSAGNGSRSTSRASWAATTPARCDLLDLGVETGRLRGRGTRTE